MRVSPFDFPVFMVAPRVICGCWSHCIARFRRQNYFGETLLSYFLVLLSGENLTQCVTVSTKIPKQLKEKMRQLKIKPSGILRKAIEDEVKKREMEELKQEINKLKPILEKVSMDDIVESVREDRESR